MAFALSSLALSSLSWGLAACGQSTAVGDHPSNQAGVDGGAAEEGVVDNGPACLALSRAAARAVIAALESVPECDVDADCVPVAVEATCWPSCLTSSLAGNRFARTAIGGAGYEVSSLCGSARQLGCNVLQVDCPGQLVGSSFACDTGRCVLREPVRCQDLAAQADDAIVAASRSVPQCVLDADCVPIAAQAPCAQGWCGLDIAGGQAVRDAVTGALAGPVAALCDRFAQGACVLIPASCPALVTPASYRCTEGQCLRSPS